MSNRLVKELALLKTVFPDVEFHEVDSGWFRIPRYTVQYGGWKQTEVEVCFQVPGGYPGDAPYAFWVSPLLRQAGNDAAPTNNYQEPSPTPFSSVRPLSRAVMGCATKIQAVRLLLGGVGDVYHVFLGEYFWAPAYRCRGTSLRLG